MIELVRLVSEAKKHLSESEAEQIVQGAYRHITGRNLSRLELYSEELASTGVERLAQRYVQRRTMEGIPLQHLLRFQQFLEHEYEVGPQALLPRPETELLVRTAIDLLESPQRGGEIGLGSGIISIELLSQFPDLVMQATELSDEAISLAQINAQRILEKPQSLQIIKVPNSLSVLESFKGPLDFLISNPPYLFPQDPIQEEVAQFEPDEALFPENGDALFFYKEIAVGSHRVLGPRGKLFVEIAHQRAQQVWNLFADQPVWSDVHIINDLAGLPRILFAERTE